MEIRISRDLLTAMLRVQARLPLSTVERALIAGNLDHVVRLVGLEPVVNALYETQSTLGALRQDAWNAALGGLPGRVLRSPLVEVSFGAFEGQRPDLVDALRRMSLSRVTAMTDETRGAVRDALQRAILNGTPPREVARQIRDLVGLNRRQVAAVQRFRARLEREGRDPAQVNRMTARYARQQLTLRAESIARTETFRVLNEAKRLQWERLVREGVIRSADWLRVWVTAKDERVCPICRPLNRVTAVIGAPYRHADDVFDGPPAHPRCRCVEVLELSALHAPAERVA